MGVLNTFLNLGKQSTKPINELEKEIIVSKRFKDDNGNVLKWKIRGMNSDAYDALIEKHNNSKIVDGQLIEMNDRVSWQSELIVESVVDPDLKDAQLCKLYGTIDPTEAVRKMLLPGEYLHLVREIMKLNGFYENYQDDEVFKAAKN